MATSIDDNAVIGQSDKSMYQLIYIRCTSKDCELLLNEYSKEGSNQSGMICTR